MPDYKKRRRRRGIAPKVKPNAATKRAQKIEVEEEISTREPRKRPSFKFNILKGNKTQKRKKSLIGLALVILLILAVVFVNISYPATLSSSYNNIVALLGNGSYPIAVKGSQTLNFIPYKNYYYALTDTNVCVYSNSGKEMFSAFHGFTKPVLATSSGNAIVYDQGGKQLMVISPTKLKGTVNTENEIIAAAISDSGKFAVATYSDKYSAAVIVYNSRNRVIYEWYSAEDYINNITISRNGKKIAVTTLNSKSGIFNSKLNIINFKSATPECSKTYENCLIYGLDCGNDSTFSVIKENSIECLKWFNHNSPEIKNDYSITHFKDCGSKKIAVFTRENDSADNHIIIFSSRGKVKADIKYKGTVSDVALKGHSVYCINDTNVTAVDFDSNILKNCNYGFGGVRLSVISADTVLVASDTEISKVKLK